MIQRKKTSFLVSLFYSSFFTIILLIFLVLIFISFIKTFSRSSEIKKRVDILEIEIKKLESDKTNFLETIEYLKTDFYKEKEAREKFGLQKPGEKAVVILPSEEVKHPTEEKNITKWWQFLFK
jgi:hypothetical protein